MADERIRAIDAVCAIRPPDVAREQRMWRGFLVDKIHASEEVWEGLSVERLLEKMDAAGVERAFLVAAKSGPWYATTSSHTPYEAVARVIEGHPDRFYGLAGIDPTESMEGVRRLEYAIRDLGFIGAHLYPHWFGWPPDDRRYYPFYTKCCELDVPIQMQVGHCLVYRPDIRLPSVGRPITLDTIACDLPELKLIGIHTGWPWVEEMISVAWKHPNVYIGSDAYAPKHWKQEFVHFINSWGQDKVLFGTDFPVIEPERAIREIEELNLRPAAKRKLLRDNALRVYNLKDEG
jgi:predicted TIM-barrel fold metal-dependent hydrolase